MRLNRTEYPAIHLFDEAELPLSDQVLYEPRVWWEVVQIDSSVAPAAGTLDRRSRVTLDPGNFYNGSRHKVVFTHVLVSAVNYMLEEREVAAADAVTFDNTMGIITKIEWLLSAPRRVHFSRHDIRTGALIPEPSWEPTTRYDPAPYVSSLFGVTRWSFDKPMWLPRRGRIKFDLSSAPTSGADVIAGVPDIQTAVTFDERWPAGGRFRRHARFRDRANLGYARPNPGGTPNVFFPQSSQSLPPDGFPTAGAAGAQGMWSPTGLFDARTWGLREAARGVDRTWYTGFGVMVDQIDHDEHIQTSVLPGVAGAPITPFHSRLGCRCRTEDGGTGEWWWRPGAPVSLVCPTITPAHVYRLREPLVVAKGDSLQIEVQAPGPTTIGENVITPRYNVGFSLCGYAVVEG